MKTIKPANSKEDRWYAIYTKSRFEKKINNSLERSGFKTFLPLVKEKRVWSDRLKTIYTPLLRSYVFVKTSRDQIHNLYYFPGFVRFVSFEGKPCEIKEEEIALLEKIVVHGFQVETTEECVVGDDVRIVRGPLKGWTGRVLRKNGKSRIVFQFENLQQTICVEVKACNLEKIRHAS